MPIPSTLDQHLRRADEVVVRVALVQQNGGARNGVRVGDLGAVGGGDGVHLTGEVIRDGDLAIDDRDEDLVEAGEEDDERRRGGALGGDGRVLAWGYVRQGEGGEGFYGEGWVRRWAGGDELGGEGEDLV